MTQQKLDRRIIRTRKALCDALVQLILIADYESITIRAVTDLADIGYATFYRHFKSKEDLLTFAFYSSLYELAKCLDPEMTPHAEAQVIFAHFRKHHGLFRSWFSLPRDHPVVVAVTKSIAHAVAKIYAVRDDSVVPLDVSVNHLLQASGELLRWFLFHGDDYSVEQAATMWLELVFEATEYAVLERQLSWAEALDYSFLERFNNSNVAIPETLIGFVGA